jgi:uncharacterized membrane protein
MKSLILPGKTPLPSAGWWIMLVLASAVGLASFRYLAGEAMVPFPLKPNFHSHQLWFAIHISLGTTALLVGPWQFLKALRRARPVLHRALGVVYVSACTLGGLAGLVMAPGTNGGPVAAAGFGLLAVLWIYTTQMALVSVLRKDIAAHRRWMIRSFALTLAGVTLRLYLPLALIHIQDFSRVYSVIAWACWVPNLLLGLWLTRKVVS